MRLARLKRTVQRPRENRPTHEGESVVRPCDAIRRFAAQQSQSEVGGHGGERGYDYAGEHSGDFKGVPVIRLFGGGFDALRGLDAPPEHEGSECRHAH